MARSGRPTKEQSEELSRRIIGVATSMFLDKGYAATTIEELACELRASKRSIYNRFADKASLFKAVTVSYAAQSLQTIDHCITHGSPPEEQIHQACLNVLGLFLTPDVVAIERVVVHEAGQFPEIVPILESARLSAMHRLQPAIAALGRWSVDEAHTRDAAQILWDLTIAAQVRGAALGLWRPEVTEQTRTEMRKRINLFLHGYAALIQSQEANAPVETEGERLQ
ncbi:TetR/AcrR family transcriptional regulator [Sphingobium lactosutens]|uniref:HTH tetR-type domain-containing protein n=1 Tax=Sphingobium lactosutens DS20 TaxID=1331060 RepID=T0ISX8_9SPHN|nr:TetR family transcriptional regulator [Sphingobium lactosutens]EQB14930.1 hypothetical protein RLDS_12225 [Sphingobium lactosutens DS20]